MTPDIGTDTGTGNVIGTGTDNNIGQSIKKNLLQRIVIISFD